MKKDDLRTRGFGVLGKLIKTKGAEALPDVLAWERDYISAFPQDKPVGKITAEEGDWAAGEMREMDPNFTLAHRSTMLLDDGTPAATAFTNLVRLHRLDHLERSGGTEHTEEPGEPPAHDKSLVDRADEWLCEIREHSERTKAASVMVISKRDGLSYTYIYRESSRAARASRGRGGGK